MNSPKPKLVFGRESSSPDGGNCTSGRKIDFRDASGIVVPRLLPLMLMYPEADIPVFQVSILRGASAVEHERLGNALSALRNENMLVIGSGSLTHNLYEFRGQELDSPAPTWVTDFGNWMKDALQEGKRDALLDYRRQAPAAERNHPTEEHLMPLYVAMGAAGSGAKATQLHSSYEYGILAMDVYQFE